MCPWWHAPPTGLGASLQVEPEVPHDTPPGAVADLRQVVGARLEVALPGHRSGALLELALGVGGRGLRRQRLDAALGRPDPAPVVVDLDAIGEHGVPPEPGEQDLLALA